MCVMLGGYSESAVVDSQLGKRMVDSEGAPISGVRMDVSKAYEGVPELLQKVINENDTIAWAEIANKIDYMYINLDYSLAGLDRETGFGREIRSQIRSGKKLFFKPNLVGPHVIDWATHGEGLGAPICTEWPLIAALMRWFHDKLDISYHQMALGEASSGSFITASTCSKFSGKTITTEAIFEGRSADFYGGWGFFFVRRYLAECHPSSHKDDPMRGYEDSIAGRFLPPGKAIDRLMVYDLNRIQEDISTDKTSLAPKSTGRTVAVPNGANFKEVTLHKVIIGGDPNDDEDVRDYPGCVLVNVPKSKIHPQDLITNAIKNLGIGLYPTQCAMHNGKQGTFWKYSYPNTSLPFLKGKLPHSPWILEIDDDTYLPARDEAGKYIATKTAGFPGTQSDVIRAVQNQNVFMLHIVDAINAINISHDPDGRSVRIPEGYVWSSLDCVALDLFWARYLFKTVPMDKALKLKEENSWPTEFVHHVPVARIDGKNIVTDEGLDSPLFRYNLYRYAERRGVGQQKYYVLGFDSLTETPLASLEGHLGRIDNAKFIELMTKTMYYNPDTILHDLQETIFSYLKAHDDLTGSQLLKEFMDSFDENNDGIIDYDEMGRNGIETAMHSMNSYAAGLQFADEYGKHKETFIKSTYYIKYSNKNWNSHGHDFARDKLLVLNAAIAFNISNMIAGGNMSDPFIPWMKIFNGKWPSWQSAAYSTITFYIYGHIFIENISLKSIYGAAFQYADKVSNNGDYTGSIDQMVSIPKSINNYFEAVSKGSAPLDFTLYVPKGYGSMRRQEAIATEIRIPNVVETDDPQKTFTAHFNSLQEIW